MTLSGRISQREAADGETRPSRLYTCPDCGFADPDPEATFGHMIRRECPVPERHEPEWMRRRRVNGLPVKVRFAA